MEHEAPSPDTTEELFRLKTGEARQRLHEYRVYWESANNAPTDQRVIYTSQAPTEVQDWLIEHQPQLYFDGLPPFVRAFFEERCRDARGSRDNLPSLFVKLFVTNRGRLSARM